MPQEWWSAASSWIEDAVHRGGGGVVRRTARVPTSGGSIVLRIEDARSAFYFKAASASPYDEGPLLALIGRRCPDEVPELIAHDPIRHWMLTRAVDGRLLFLDGNVERWCGALARFGAMQRRLAPCVDELRTAGCRSFTIRQVVDDLAMLIDPTGADALALPMTAEERQRLRETAAVWRRLGETASIGVGDALDHADLHPNNILVTDRGYVYLDWEDAAVSHPFLAPHVLLGYVDRLLPDMRPAAAALRDAYLSAWRDVAPWPALTAAFRRLQPIAYVKFAIGLARARVEAGACGGLARARVGGAIADCLRSALACDAA